MRKLLTRARRLTLAVALALAALAGLTGTALAQTGEAAGSSTLPYLFAAFAVAWAFIFGYLFFMARRQHDLERTTQEIKERLGGSK